MKDDRILVEPFNFISILQCEIHKSVNEHFFARVSGYICEKETDQLVLETAENQEVSIIICESDGSKYCIFKGIIESISMELQNGLKTLTVNALSYTSLLDKKPMTRVFQNSRLTYKYIFEHICEQYPNALCIFAEGKGALDSMALQYEETDWTFFKRLASWLNTVLIADSQNGNICFCLGTPKRSTPIEINPVVYSITKYPQEYLHKKVSGVSGINGGDDLEYIIELRDVLELCAPVRFKNQLVYVYRVDSKLVGNEFVHEYRLRTLNGFKTITCQNDQIIGASLIGKVLKVRDDRVQISIDCDDDRPDGVAKWFEFATVYSSPEGTGWYCMPEQGDTVRVYFPDAEEEHAYVVSAVHLGAVDKLRTDPDEKSIRTIHDKEIRFTPSKILITNHDGLSITLDDKTGIRISSQKKIELEADAGVQINSGEQVHISATKAVVLNQNGNSLVMCNGIALNGLSINCQ